MTNQKPTGVFIRLPLSDEQHDTLYHTIRSSGDEVALIAIGTQVACSELEVFDICDAAYGNNNEKYVRQSDHQAALAQCDAEIARLRKALEGAKTFHEEQDKAISKQPPSAQGQWRRHQHQEQIENIEEALKGPEE